jgi:hypothetical protein
MNTIRETSKLDVVVVWAGNNKLFFFTIFSMIYLDNVDAIDYSTMYLNKPDLMDVVRGKVYSKFVIGKVP